MRTEMLCGGQERSTVAVTFWGPKRRSSKSSCNLRRRMVADSSVGRRRPWTAHSLGLSKYATCRFKTLLLTEMASGSRLMSLMLALFDRSRFPICILYERWPYLLLYFIVLYSSTWRKIAIFHNYALYDVSTLLHLVEIVVWYLIQKTAMMR